MGWGGEGGGGERLRALAKWPIIVWGRPAADGGAPARFSAFAVGISADGARRDHLLSISPPFRAHCGFKVRTQVTFCSKGDCAAEPNNALMNGSRGKKKVTSAQRLIIPSDL